MYVIFWETYFNVTKKKIIITNKCCVSSIIHYDLDNSTVLLQY